MKEKTMSHIKTPKEFLLDKYEYLTNKDCIADNQPIIRDMQEYAEYYHSAKTTGINEQSQNKIHLSSSICPYCGDSSNVGVEGCATIYCPNCHQLWLNED